MKTTAWKLAVVACVLCLVFPAGAFAQSPVPDELPADLGGKTLYGYLMDLKNTYLPAKVFSDPVKYADADRENARRAARLVADAATAKMEEARKPDQYNLYLRAWAQDLMFQDGKDPALRDLALMDYLKTVELGGGYAQADHDRLAAMEVQAAPLSWEMPQMLTPEEAGGVLGVPAGDVLLVSSPYQQADGSRLGMGYALRSMVNPWESAVFVLTDPQGGKARYDALKRSAFLGRVSELPGLGDEAVQMGLRNMDHAPLLYTTALVLKGSLVLQVRVPDARWRGPGFNMDPAAIARALAGKFLQNLYDTARQVPDRGSFTAGDIMPVRQLAAGLPDSPVPDAMPEDLGGKTSYGYLVDLRKAYLFKDVFSDAKYGEADRNNARRALKLVAETLSQGFDRNGPNPYELEIRGYCYALAFADTGDPAYRQLAINDYKQAMSLSYALAKADHDRLAAPLLASMAEMKEGSSGGQVALLQGWLVQAGFLQGTPTGNFDGVTVNAVKAYEESAGLTPDGIADIAFLLSLYAKIDDGDTL